MHIAAVTSEGQIAVSYASSVTIQTQPQPGSCHDSSPTPYSLPDPHCTPGALNPAVTQATLDSTICRSGYTKTIRPSTDVTDPEKLASIRAYGDTDSPGNYEYDHLISLELGGAANDPRNLWPEPEASPNPKDRLENWLNSLVCDGQLPLAIAQHEIATNWIRYYDQDFGATATSGSGSTQHPSNAPSANSAPVPAYGGSCTASTSDPNPGRGADETITVHTTADASVTTVEDYKTKDSQHDGTATAGGVASITFSVGSPSAGYTVKVSISTSSGQHCSTSFTPR